jgi:hypothetical protein
MVFVSIISFAIKTMPQFRIPTLNIDWDYLKAASLSTDERNNLDTIEQNYSLWDDLYPMSMRAQPIPIYKMETFVCLV